MGNLTRLGWLYVWMAVGCVIPHGEDRATRCSKSGRCAPGLVCHQQLCVVDESSAEVESDVGGDASAVLADAGTPVPVPSAPNGMGGLDAAMSQADAAASPPPTTAEDAGPSDAGTATTLPDAQSEEPPPACPCCAEHEGKKACKKACRPSDTSKDCSSCDRSCRKGSCTPGKCGAL